MPYVTLKKTAAKALQDFILSIPKSIFVKKRIDIKLWRIATSLRFIKNRQNCKTS